jgi:aminoglycoside phosphotransferase
VSKTSNSNRRSGASPEDSNPQAQSKDATRVNNSQSHAPGKTPPAMAFDPIATALRRLHDNVVAEPIPDDFMRLLDKIDDRREGLSS